MIKVCINPHCDEVAHNIEKKETRCRNCDMVMVQIDKSTYLKRFADRPHQIDYKTGERVTPAQVGFSVQMKIDL